MQRSILGKQMATGLALALAIAGCSKPESPEELFAQAKQYEAKGENKAAIIQLKNVLQDHPDDLKARLELGRIYLKTGDPVSAEKELQRALKLASNRSEVLPLLVKSLMLQNKAQAALDVAASAPPGAMLLSLRGDALLALKKLDESRAAYDAALKLDPNQADALNGMARHALLKKDIEGAVRLADAAVGHNPADVDALMFRGDLDKAMGKLDNARAAYDKALQLNPASGAAHLQKAYIDISQGNYDAARADIAAVKKTAPQAMLVYHAQAQLEFTQGKYQEARDSIQHALKAFPEHMPVQLLAGAIQFALGSLPQAEQHLKKYVESDPGNVYARKMLASVELGLGRPAEALAQVAAVLPRSEDNVLLNVAAKAHMQLNQFGQAAALYERAIKAMPDFAQSHMGLGLARMSLGNGAGAIEAMRKGLELSPANAVDTGIVLGMTHLQLKQYDRAEAVFNEMLARQPNSALLYNLLGGALLGKEDRPAARAAFDKSLQLQPAFFTPLNNLARMDLADRKPASARQRLEGFIGKNAGNVEALTALAELAQAENRQADATKWLEQASAANPALPGPGLRLTRQYLDTGEKRKALTLIRTMQIADPGNPVLLEMLGRVQWANGDRQAALEAYNRLAAVQPRAAGATSLAAAYEEMGERDLAADTLRKAHGEHPHDASLMLARAVVEMRRHNYDQAVTLARQAQGKPGSLVAGLVVEAEIRQAQGKPDLAIAPYQKAVQANKNDTPLRIKLANAHRQSGRMDEAVKLVQHWRSERPNDLALGVYLGELYVAQKKYPAAIELFNGLLERLPGNGIILNNLALAYQAAGDARALQTAELALKSMPASTDAQDTLGWLLVENGDLARGIATLQKASAAAPGASEIRYHLAAAYARNNDKAAARKELETLLATKGEIAHVEQARTLLKQLSQL